VIGLDTNVLVRFLVKDDAVQWRQAADLMASLTGENPGFVSIVTTVELSWVLRSTYGLSRSRVAALLRRLASAGQLVLEDADHVLQAVRLAEDAGCDVSDALIALRSRRAGSKKTVTFDRRATRLPGVELVGSASEESASDETRANQDERESARASERAAGAAGHQNPDAVTEEALWQGVVGDRLEPEMDA
jgi:predicted nucleic-acid-binding protein